MADIPIPIRTIYPCYGVDCGVLVGLEPDDSPLSQRGGRPRFSVRDGTLS
ncbi:MAG: hypothetical protein H6935_09645 [Thiobacillus sp.]|nr:hypothetical protein [Thiobacillus sp.]